MRIRGFSPSTPCWVELSTSDLAGATSFYAEMFGWELRDDRFQLNGQNVAGLAPDRPDVPGGWITFLATTDLAGTVRRVQDAHGRHLTWPQQRRGASSVLVQDPSGAVFGLWQAAGFPGAQLRGEPGAMEQPDLLTNDLPAASAFYGSVFGWTITDEFGSCEWLNEAHDSVAGLVTGRTGGARWLPAFQVTDATAMTDRCTRLGGRVIVGPIELGLGSYVEMIDPYGNPFAITAPVDRPVELNVHYHAVAGMEMTYRG